MRILSKDFILILLMLAGIQLSSCRGQNGQEPVSTSAATPITTDTPPQAKGLQLSPDYKPNPNLEFQYHCKCDCMQINSQLYKDASCTNLTFSWKPETEEEQKNCPKRNGGVCSGFEIVKSILVNPDAPIEPPQCIGPIAGQLANCSMQYVPVLKEPKPAVLIEPN